MNVIRGLSLLLVFLAIARGETLTLATYNVENYLAANRLTEAGYRKDYPKPETEKQALRAVIRGMNADVLVLQEMGARTHLEELRRDLRSEGLDYPHLEWIEAADPDRHVALLAKRAPKQVKAHGNLTFAYFGQREPVKRGVLQATFPTEAGDVTVFGLHLKSRFTERPDDPGSAIRRAAEATAIRDAILTECPDPAKMRFVILGDCNDGKASKALQFLSKRGKTEIATLLPAGDSRGEAWTHFYRKEESYSRVDHILVSPGLHAAVEGAAARIYDAPETKAASDHRPVMIVLNLSAAP